MKFKLDNDKKLFFTELGISETNISPKLVNKLLENRDKYQQLIKRDSYQKGINLLNESLKSKKTRSKSALSKFIDNYDKLSYYEKIESLKALSSLNTHILIEMSYYHPIYDSIELNNLYNSYSKLFNYISENIFIGIKLTDDQLELLKKLAK